MTHSVSSHLAVSTSTYDAEIRRFVPGYEAMLGAAMSAIAAHLHDVPKPAVVDLGAGTGAFTEAAMKKLPGATFTLLDADASMLVEARTRLAAKLDRATFVHGSFFDRLPACDVAMASLSLHHVHDPEKKRALYANIRASLAPGGALVTADAMVPSDEVLKARVMKTWAAHLVSHGDREDAAYARFTQWAAEDRYFSIEEELAFLRAAGFESVDVAWRSGPIAVVIALR